MSKLLVIVDYQNDFVNGTLGFAGAETLEDGLYEKAQQTLQEGGYVLFTRDTHPIDYSDTREGKYLPVAHCIAGSKGHQLYGRLHEFEGAIQPHTLVVNKYTFGLHDIGAYVNALCEGAPDTIEVCGLVTDICVIANAILLHSAFPYADVRVLSALCGSGNKQNAANALALLQGMGIPTEA